MPKKYDACCHRVIMFVNLRKIWLHDWLHDTTETDGKESLNCYGFLYFLKLYSYRMYKSIFGQDIPLVK